MKIILTKKVSSEDIRKINLFEFDSKFCKQISGTAI